MALRRFQTPNLFGKVLETFKKAVASIPLPLLSSESNFIEQIDTNFRIENRENTIFIITNDVETSFKISLESLVSCFTQFVISSDLRKHKADNPEISRIVSNYILTHPIKVCWILLIVCLSLRGRIKSYAEYRKELLERIWDCIIHSSN